MMLIHGLRLIRENDNAYKLIDANGRTPGYVARWYGPDGKPRFRAFGKDFGTLPEAVAAFLSIPWLQPCDAA